MSRREKRIFSDEYKAEAVELVRTSGKSIGRIAKELDITETSLRQWVKAAERESAPVALTGSEREELERLRKDVRTLRMERDFLKKAAAFFAKDNA
jgi:transposase-like protein